MYLQIFYKYHSFILFYRIYIKTIQSVYDVIQENANGLIKAGAKKPLKIRVKSCGLVDTYQVKK